MRRGVDQQAVRHVHHRRDQRREPLPGLEPRARVAIALDQRRGRAELALQERASPAPASPIVPLTQSWSPGRAPARDGTGPAARPIAVRPSARGAPAGIDDRVAAEQRQAEGGRAPCPSPSAKARSQSLVAERVAEQHADRPRALGGEVGQVHRDQLPGDVAGRIVGQIVDALDDHVVGEDERLAADLEHRRVVEQAARAGGIASASARSERSMKSDFGVTL